MLMRKPTTMRKMFIGIAAFAILIPSITAQISGSVKIGLSGYQGDLHCRTDENIQFFDGLKASLGLGVRLPLSNALGIRGEATYFQIDGDESEFGDVGHANRGWSFKHNFIELSALIDWELLGNRRFSKEDKKFRRTLTPVLFAGGGLVLSNPKVDFKNASSQKISNDIEEGRKVNFSLPIGIGLKYYLTEDFALAVETGIRMPVSDYYDGLGQAGGEALDSYGFGGVKAYLNFGKKRDTDGDGIPDQKDQCPSIPGLKAFQGCPDRDNDGVADQKDQCPDLFGIAKFNGCPDTDGDGLADTEDDCPQVPGAILFNGCPDSDGDGISDVNDDCPNLPGIRSLAGCPDSDGDGVIDSKDECPTEYGFATNNGCPNVDSDGDGVVDRKDLCPNEKGLESLEGCPDNDGDGVPNQADKCPDIAGTTVNGCPKEKPIVAKPAIAPKVDIGHFKNQIAAVAREIEFSTGSSNITSVSLSKLEEVVDILKKNPSFKMSINGYTDSRGNDLFNLRLSQRRAKAVFDYFVNKEISANRLSHNGLGEANPIESNETAEGRRRNRRVEFVLD